jgi:hypothetical protein
VTAFDVLFVIFCICLEISLESGTAGTKEASSSFKTLRRNCCSIVGRRLDPSWLEPVSNGLAISWLFSFAMEDSGTRTLSGLVAPADSPVSFDAHVPIDSDSVWPSIILSSVLATRVGAGRSPSLVNRLVATLGAVPEVFATGIRLGFFLLLRKPARLARRVTQLRCDLLKISAQPNSGASR